MKIKLLQNVITHIYDPYDQSGSSKYVETIKLQLNEIIEVSRVSGREIFFPDGKHAVLFDSEYEIV